MCAKWRGEGYRPPVILDRLRNSISVNDHGNVQGTIMEYFDLSVVVESAVEFHSDVPGRRRRSIINKAIQECTKRNEFCPNVFIKSINERERRYLKQPLYGATAVASVSVPKTLPRKRISRKIGSNTIIFQPNFPKIFREEVEREMGHIAATMRVRPEIFQNYCPVVFKSKVRHVDDIIDQFEDDFDTMRGIINFILNYGRKFIIMTSTYTPINGVRLGPFLAIFSSYDNMDAPRILHEPLCIPAGKLENIWENWEKLSNQINHILRNTSNKRLGRYARSAFIRYARALDSNDYSAAFLKLWSLLEYLTGTTQAEGKVTIRRAAALFDDRNFNTERLRHLRDYRNRSIHLSEESRDIHILLSQIRMYVEGLLRFYVNNELEVASQQELLEFMDLLIDRKQLERHGKLLRLALRYPA